MEGEKVQKVLPVNSKVKDTFFKTVYESQERLKGLAQFLLGIPEKSAEVRIANVRPVLFGNKENDLAFLCNDVIYCMMEEESTVCPNMPYRQLEYITAGLRSTVDSEEVLYSGKQVLFPVPKLYMVQVGVEERQQEITEIQYDMRLSDSYKSYEGEAGDVTEPDLEAVVHVYNFRMTRAEILEYIETCSLPERFRPYAGDLLDYALVADCLNYVQRVGKNKRYTAPVNVTGLEQMLELLKTRGIFVDLLSMQEVCNMTMATFSREDIREYQGWERGLEEGRILTISEFLSNGGDENLAKKLLKATDDELRQAKELLVNP